MDKLRKSTAAAIGGGVGGGGTIFIILLIMNYYAVSNLEFRTRSMGNFDFVIFSMDMKIDACNPSDFPAYFDKILLNINYKGRQFATMTLHGTTIMPKQAVTLNGNLDVNPQMVAGLFIQAFASAFSGNTQNTFNENEITVKATLDTKLIGLIPISQSKDYSFYEFKQLMNSQSASKFSCV